jgi:hypothetical protein
MALASSAYESAVKAVTPPLGAKTRMAAGPAISAASPVRTKMPAPIIAPMPTIVASRSPSEVCGSRWGDWLMGESVRPYHNIATL